MPSAWPEPDSVLHEQLQESELRFRIMADTAPVLLWMAGTDANCSFFNQPWLEFTGKSLEQELGVGWAEGVHPEDFQACMHTYLESFVARRGFRMEYRLRRADGDYRWILDTGVPRFTPSGRFAGFIGSCIDITDLKSVHDELERKVAERTAELEAFTYSVSHDLRAPLRHIAGLSQALLEDCGPALDQAGLEHAQGIIAAAARMGHLIDDLLRLSRMGTVELRVERVDVSALARSILDELARAEPARRPELAIAPGMELEGDRDSLRIALTNLLENAWKFTSKTAAARIELSLAERGGEQVLCVRDNGAGFDPSFATRMFAPFQRSHRSEDFPGLGIGLAIVRRIAHRHGGRVWAEGAVGRGAAFYLALPRAQAPRD